MNDRINYSSKNSKIEIEFKVKEVPKIFTILLFVLSLISFSIPIITVILFHDKITFRFLLTLILFWVAAYFLTRMFLWNTFGSKKLSITKNRCSFYYDFKWFRQNEINIEFKELDVSIDTNDLNADISSDNLPIDHQISILGTLQLTCDEQLIRSNFQFPVSDLVLLSKKIINDHQNL
jgi:hypothetical protein